MFFNLHRECLFLHSRPPVNVPIRRMAHWHIFIEKDRAQYSKIHASINVWHIIINVSFSLMLCLLYTNFLVFQHCRKQVVLSHWLRKRLFIYIGCVQSINYCSPGFTWTSLFCDLFLILIQNEKQVIEFCFLQLTMMCHKSWDRVEIWRKFVSRLWISPQPYITIQ